jgi:hypothetical protein
MSSTKWFIPLVCAGTSLLAQTNDLNGLVSAASHYVSSGLAAARVPETLGLSKISGDYSTQYPGAVMSKASDVQHWTFLYKVNKSAPPTLDGLADPAPKEHVAVTAECTTGVFNNFKFSDQPVTGVKSLEFIWVAQSLDSAIANLNANGYVRGFSKVSIVRPDAANWSDELVYVFNCPFERREVAISAQTGALTWTYNY